VNVTNLAVIAAKKVESSIITVKILLPDRHTIEVIIINSIVIKDLIQFVLPDKDISKLSIFIQNDPNVDINHYNQLLTIIKQNQIELKLFILERVNVIVTCYKHIDSNDLMICTLLESIVKIITIQEDCKPWFTIEEFHISDLQLCNILMEYTEITRFELPIRTINIDISNSKKSIVWRDGTKQNCINYFLLRGCNTEWDKGFWKYDLEHNKQRVTNFICDFRCDQVLYVNNTIRKKFLVKNKKSPNNPKISKWFNGIVISYNKRTTKYTIKYEDNDIIIYDSRNLIRDIINKNKCEKIDYT
jgi:hypothetical protein